MADTDVQVKFGAEVSDLQAGVGAAKTAIADVSTAVKDLKSAFSGLSNAPASILREDGAAAAESAAGFAAVAGPLGALTKILVPAAQQMGAFGQKMGETAEQALQTAQTFGLTIGQVQELNAEAALFGVPAASMTNAMQGLGRSFTAARDGATVQASAFADVGVSLQKSYTPTQLMQAALEGLSRMAPGPAKAATAVAIFGQNVEKIAPLLGLTTAQIKDAEKAISGYGAVNEQAAAKGLALGDAFNVNKVAMQGVNNVMTEAFAPALTEVVDGVNALIKAFTDSYNQGGVVRAMLDGIGIVLQEVETAVLVLGAVWKVQMDALDGGVEIVRDVLSTLRADIAGPLISAVGSIEAAWRTVAQPVMQVVAQIIRGVGDMADAVFGFLRSIPGIGPAFASVQRDASASLKRIVDDVKSAQQAMHDIWEGKPPPNMPGEVSWTGPQGAAGGGHGAHRVRGAPQDQPARIEQAPQAASAAPAEPQGDGGLKAATTPVSVKPDAVHAKDLASLSNMQDKALASVDKHQAQLTQAITNGDNVRGQIDQRAADAMRQRWGRAVGSITNDFAQGVVKIARGSQTWSQLWNSLTERMESQFASKVAGMLTSWLMGDQAKQQSAQQTAERTTQAQAQGAQQGLMAHLASTLKQITADAAKAASSTYAAVAAIPIVGPFLAPEAAAAAFAAVMAFEGMVSAEGGYDIPYGVNPLTQLHQNEMVLPATLAQPLRGFLHDYGTGGEGPWGAGGGRGDTNITLNHAPSISGGAPVDVIKHLEKNKLEFAKLLNRMARDRHFSAARA